MTDADTGAITDVERDGLHIFQSSSLGKITDEIHEAIRLRSVPFGEEAGIKFWSEGFGFQNETVRSCLEHFRASLLTSHLLIGKNNTPGIFASTSSISMKQTLLVFAFESDSIITVWIRSHLQPKRVAEGKNRKLFLEVDPESLRGLKEETIILKMGGRIIMDPRLCFRIVQGQATMFVYRPLDASNIHKMRFPSALREFIESQEIGDLRVFAEYE